jgi:hypothetical protein
MFSHINSHRLLFSGLLTLFCHTSFASDGELWETSSTMQSQQFGKMTLPPVQDCHPREWLGQPSIKSKHKQDCSETTEQVDDDLYLWTQRCPVSETSAELRRINDKELAILVNFSGPEGKYLISSRSVRIGSCDLSEEEELDDEFEENQ